MFFKSMHVHLGYFMFFHHDTADVFDAFSYEYGPADGPHIPMLDVQCMSHKYARNANECDRIHE